MLVLISALIVAASVAWAGVRVANAVQARRGTSRPQTAELMALFAPGIEAVRQDPRALLTWQPLASAARTIWPQEFAVLDAASGRRFPFTADDIQAAHARWSADWLAWELAHDGEYKRKAAAALEELGDRSATPAGRARLEGIEREKLERYQQRYAEYVRVSKALQGLE